MRRTKQSTRSAGNLDGLLQLSQFHFDLGVYYLNARHLILSYLMPVGWFFMLGKLVYF